MAAFQSNSNQSHAAAGARFLSALTSRKVGNKGAAFLSLALSAGALLAFAPIGCGSDPGPNTEFDAAGGTEGGLDLGDGGGLDLDAQAISQYTDISISPQNAVLTVALGQTNPSIDYTVTGKRRSDGKVVPITGGVFEYTRFDAAAFTQAKLLPTGFVGGVGEVKFKLGLDTATTVATVKILATAGTPPAPAIVAALDAAVTPDASAKIIYPYDGTVFPRGFAAPILQWQGPNNVPVYRVKAVSPTFELVAYVTASPANGRFDFPKAPADIWNRLTDSTSGKLTISIQRYDGTTAFKPVEEIVSIAPGSLKSSVYYTRLAGEGTSDVRRIEPGQQAQDYLIKNGEACIACHSISRDGKRTVAGINGGESKWGVWDNKTGVRLFQSNEPSGFQAISPDGDYVVWGQSQTGANGNKLFLSKYNNEIKLAELIAPTGSPVVPVFSPDGKKIAFGARTDGNWLDYNGTSIYTTDVALGAAPGFSNYKKIVDPDAAFVSANSPTFSPDAKWIGFMRANKSRGSDADSRGELWVTDIDGVVKVRLDRANGKGVLADVTSNWGPNFHPIAAGGYFWVAFYAKRAHGHIKTSDTRQLWIAAVSSNIQAGTDPSFPAFYIPGQDADTLNERPQFAIPICKDEGTTCDAGYECCDGFCRADAGGKLICQKPKPNECARSGDVCKVDADCCVGACLGGSCQLKGPN